VIGPSQRPLPDNIQHSQEIDFHPTGRIRTRNPSKRVEADLRLRPRVHRNRFPSYIVTSFWMEHRLMCCYMFWVPRRKGNARISFVLFGEHQGRCQRMTFSSSMSRIIFCDLLRLSVLVADMAVCVCVCRGTFNSFSDLPHSFVLIYFGQPFIFRSWSLVSAEGLLCYLSDTNCYYFLFCFPPALWRRHPHQHIRRIKTAVL
jgi:hypothetical protein